VPTAPEVSPRAKCILKRSNYSRVLAMTHPAFVQSHGTDTPSPVLHRWILLSLFVITPLAKRARYGRASR
jgi:hypothetical protein